jgi:hypothetical protein
MKHLYLESKILKKLADKTNIPNYKKFACIVDQMLFDYKEMKESDVII